MGKELRQLFSDEDGDVIPDPLVSLPCLGKTVPDEEILILKGRLR